MQIEFTVIGDPVPQGSKSGFVRGGKVVIVEGKGKGTVRHKAWRKEVADAAQMEADRIGLVDPIDGPIEVEIHFWMNRPKSKHRLKMWCEVTPDIDKLARSVLDSITGPIIVNDSRVVSLKLLKMYAQGDPGVVVRVTPLDNDDCPFKPEML